MDKIDENCNCVGTISGNVECPEYNANVGEPCDDNDPNTEDEWLEEGCKCVGRVINGCNLTIRTQGNSIIVENVDDPRNKVYLWDRTFSNLLDESCAYWTDCQGNQTFSNLLPGVYALQYQSFSENWTKIYCDSTVYIEIGGVPTANACDAVSLTVADDQLTISNLSSLNTVIDIFDYQYASVFRCVGDCGTSQTIADLAEGKNIVRVKIYDAEWNFVCEREDIFDVTGTGIIAADDRNSLRPTISTETTATPAALSVSQFTIAPNPAKDFIELGMKNYVDSEVEITIYNTLGAVVHQQHFVTLEQKSLRVDISQFTYGLHVVAIQRQGFIQTEKFIHVR